MLRDQPHPVAHGTGFRDNTAQVPIAVWFLTDRRSGLRNSLVTALVSCADTPLKAKARRFLQGLSADELQFIAEFLGACMLEAPERSARSRAEFAQQSAA